MFVPHAHNATSGSKAATPIVLVGIHSEIGGAIAEGLRPDWEVIRQIQSYSAALTDLPHILRSQPPPSKATNKVGTENYARPVRAVVFGRGFSQEQAESLYNKFSSGSNSNSKSSSSGAGKAKSVLWVASDDANRPEGTEPPAGVEKVMLPVLKKVLEDWKNGEEGEGEEGGKDKFVLY